MTGDSLFLTAIAIPKPPTKPGMRTGIIIGIVLAFVMYIIIRSITYIISKRKRMRKQGKDLCFIVVIEQLVSYD